MPLRRRMTRPDPAPLSAWRLRAKRLGDLSERFARPLGLVLSLVLLLVVLRQARDADWSVLLGNDARLSATFLATFAAYYLLSPCAEWLIYTRLWGFDRSAFPALLRKFVANELLLDYLGDVQFLAWAHARRMGDGAPFAAVKDVTILSALTGNLVTLALMVLAWPFVVSHLPGLSLRAILVSLGVILVVSTVLLVLGKRIFSHPARTLAGIGAVLVLRTVGALALAAVLWHMLMPAAALWSLFLLATLRMIVSRLPLVPSKDLLFAGLAVIAFGRADEIAVTTAMIASLVLLAHVIVGALLAIAHLASARRRRSAAGDEAEGPDQSA